MTKAEYEIKNAKQLLDGKITGFITDPSDEEYGGDAFWGFTVQKGKKTYNVWVNCDPEGNGPGHLAIAIEHKQ